MAKQDQFIRLLLVEDSAEDAEQVVSQLRNGGMAVRPVRAESRDHLTDQLVNQPVDIVLVNLKSKLMPIADVTRLATQAGKDRTVVAITPMINDDVALALQRAGVFAFALRSHPDHLQAVVRHEFEALSARRALRRIDVSLKETERRAEALLDSSRDPIAFVHEGMHVRANKAYLDMFGFDDFEEIEGISILDMIAPEAAGGFKDLLKKLSKGEKPPSKLEVKAQKSDGSPFDAVMEFAEATFEGEPCQQITLRPQRSGVDAAQLDELRSKDLVTGLFNRTHALAELDRVVAEAANGSSDAALLMLEPDNYRGVADNIGLGSMDLLYSDLAQHLRQHARETDLAARFSDTVLLLLLRGTTHDEAQKRAQALRKSFEDKIFEAGSKSLPVPVSIGMVLIGERIANADAILGNASSNLKAAQAAGGNKVKVFDPAAQDKADAAAEKLRVEQLQDALRKNGFVLFYQPIISLHGAEGEFYEILLRMLGANGEQLMPAEFFPIAEKHGLLAQLDRIAGKPITVIGTTNYMRGIDTAIQRSGRFDLRVPVFPPTQEDRAAIFSFYLRRHNPGSVAGIDAIDIDIDALAAQTRLFTPADIKAVVELALRRAVYDAGQRGEGQVPVLNMEAIRETLRQHQRSIQRDDALRWIEEAQVALGAQDERLLWLTEEVTAAYGE